MSTLLALDSTESVIEVLFDIALAVYLARLAFIYAVLVALSTVVLAWVLHVSWPLLPSQLQAGFLTAGSAGGFGVPAYVTLFILIIALCSRLVVAGFGVPRVSRFRLFMGALAAVYAGLATLLAAWTLRTTFGENWARGHQNQPEAVAHSAMLSCAIFGPVFVAGLALMPWLSMVLLEQPPSERRDRAFAESSTPEKKNGI